MNSLINCRISAIVCADFSDKLPGGLVIRTSCRACVTTIFPSDRVRQSADLPPPFRPRAHTTTTALPTNAAAVLSSPKRTSWMRSFNAACNLYDQSSF